MPAADKIAYQRGYPLTGNFCRCIVAPDEKIKDISLAAAVWQKDCWEV